MDPRVKAGIFAGESGGDWDALFGFSNRPGGAFAGTKISNMTVDEAIEFANPRGPYAQWVKGQIGRVATPMGGFQIVGTTLKAAKNALGLSGNERMTPEVQERLGDMILKQQGTGAWAGYKGPREPTPGTSYTVPDAPGKVGGDSMVARNFDPAINAAQPESPGLHARHPSNPMVGQPGDNPLVPSGGDDRELLAALLSGGGKNTRSSFSDQVKDMFAGFGGKAPSLGQAPQMAQQGLKPVPTQAVVDPQQAEAKRMLLAQAMQRMFPQMQGGMG